MSIKINIPGHSRHFTNNIRVVEVDGNTVGECLNHLVKKFPEIKTGLFDKDGELLNYFSIYVNGESAYPEELIKPVKDGDELHYRIDNYRRVTSRPALIPLTTTQPISCLGGTF